MNLEEIINTEVKNIMESILDSEDPYTYLYNTEQLESVCKQLHINASDMMDYDWDDVLKDDNQLPDILGYYYDSKVVYFNIPELEIHLCYYSQDEQDLLIEDAGHYDKEAGLVYITTGTGLGMELKSV